MDTKPFWTSKTLWANVIAGIAAVSTAFGLNLGLDPDTQVAIVGGVMALVNIVLRLITTSPVSAS